MINTFTARLLSEPIILVWKGKITMKKFKVWLVCVCLVLLFSLALISTQSAAQMDTVLVGGKQVNASDLKSPALPLVTLQDFSFLAPNLPSGMDIQNNEILMVAEQAAFVYVINASDGKVIRSVPLPSKGDVDPGGFGIAEANGVWWHSDYQRGMLYKLNPANGAILAQYPMPSTIYTGLNYYLGITWDGSNLWGVNPNTRMMHRIDTSTGAILNSVSLYSIEGPLDITWDNTYYWVCERDGYDFHQVNAAGNILQTKTAALPALMGIAAQPPNYIWVGNRDGLITRYDALLGPDLKINAIEVTQAVQDLNNGVALVADKRTYVRVHVSAPVLVPNVTAGLTGQRDSGSLGLTLLPRNAGMDIDVKTNPDRGQLEDSFWFELPSSWLAAGNLTLTARIDPGNGLHDPNLSNNTKSVTVNLQSTPPLRLEIVNVPYTVSGTTYQAATLHLNMLESWLRRAYPIAQLDSAWSIFTYVESGVPDATLLNLRLASARLFDLLFNDQDSRVVYYGIVDDGGGFMRGAGILGGRTAAGPTGSSNTWGWDYDGSYGDWYGAHEIGHTRNRNHAEFCGAPDGVPYPYTDGHISPSLTGDTALYGFDIENHTIYPPDWYDLMTYCDSLWVSDFTYEGIRDYLVANDATTIQTTQALADEFVLVSGMADLGAHTAQLDSIYLIQQTRAIPLPVAGDWVIALQDAAETDLVTYSFTPQALDPEEVVTGQPAMIAAALPVVEGLARVEIRYLDQVLSARQASAHAPTVDITAPLTGQELGAGTFTFAWTASDLDGDLLTFTVLYSHDNGVSWQTIASGFSQHSFDLDLNLLPGGSQSYLRVIASDGFLSGEDISGPFTLPSHAPDAQIISPEANTRFWAQQLVVFQGSAYDLEDGRLTGAALEWFSSLDGAIGVGELFSCDQLSPGRHILTLRVTDSDGQVTELQQTISVGGRSFLPMAVK